MSAQAVPQHPHVTPSTHAGRQAFIAVALAAIRGFVDAACFVGLFHVFTSHVTGNIASLASGIVEPIEHALLRIEVLFAFGLGAVVAYVSALLFKSSEKKGARALLPVLACEILWLSALLGTHFIFGLPDHSTALDVFLLTFFAGGAMGAQSVLSKLHNGIDPSTTVMTGNLSEWAMALVDSLRPGRSTGARQDRRKARRQLGLLSATLALFGAGAAAGAVGQSHFGFIVMAAPLALVLVLGVVAAWK